jgi:two-component system, NtrC family, response regulator HydG
MAKKTSPLDIAAFKAEYAVIVETLKKVDFDKAKAARLLEIDRKTLYNKLKQFRDAGVHDEIAA